MSTDRKSPHPESLALAEAFVDGIRNDAQYEYGGYMDASSLTCMTIDIRQVNLIAIADRVRAAGWRPPAQRIETAEDLDSLPVGAVILAGGQAWQGIRTPVGPLWRLAGGLSDRSSKYVLSVFGPATVLFTPGGDS